MNATKSAANLREALMDEMDAPGPITKSRIRNLLIKYPKTGPRNITTTEELDALGVGSVVKGDRFGVAIKEDGESSVPWTSDGSRFAQSSSDILSYFGIAIVLYEPEVTA